MPPRAQEDCLCAASTQTGEDLSLACHNGEDRAAAIAERQGLTIADADRWLRTYRHRAGSADSLPETIWH